MSAETKIETAEARYTTAQTQSRAAHASEAAAALSLIAALINRSNPNAQTLVCGSHSGELVPRQLSGFYNITWELDDNVEETIANLLQTIPVNHPDFSTDAHGYLRLDVRPDVRALADIEADYEASSSEIRVQTRRRLDLAVEGARTLVAGRFGDRAAELHVYDGAPFDGEPWYRPRSVRDSDGNILWQTASRLDEEVTVTAWEEKLTMFTVSFSDATRPEMVHRGERPGSVPWTGIKI